MDRIIESSLKQHTAHDIPKIKTIRMITTILINAIYFTVTFMLQEQIGKMISSETRDYIYNQYLPHYYCN